MGNQELDPKQYCKFQAVSQATFMMVCIICCICFILLIITIVFTIMNRQEHNQQSFYFFYKKIYIWLAFTFIYKFLNILVYCYIKDYKDRNSTKKCLQNNQETSKIMFISSIVLWFDLMHSFTLHSVLYIIPSIWINNILDKCLQRINQSKDLSTMKQINKHIKIVDKFQKYCSSYIRIIIICGIFTILTLAMMVFPTKKVHCYSMYIPYIPLLQSLIASFLYLYGLTLFMKFNKYNPISYIVKKHIISQYVFLVICSIARSSINIYFFIISPTDNNTDNNSYQPNCTCFDTNVDTNEKNSWSNPKQLLYVFVSKIVSDCLPLLMLLWAYRPKYFYRKTLQDTTNNDNQNEQYIPSIHYSQNQQKKAIRSLKSTIQNKQQAMLPQQNNNQPLIQQP